jgi:AcrR family transcriptional regulator
MDKVSVRSVGRPTEQIQVREKLIICARRLFTVMPYDKVSIRLIASRAGVNIAMIRYYFGNKSGLFETMLRETLSPFKKHLEKLVEESNQQNLVELMRLYYREMHKIPQLPRLISQVMQTSTDDIRRQLIEQVMNDTITPIRTVFDKLVAQGVIRDGMDPDLCRISYLSLMVFPFLAAPALMTFHGIQLNEDFLEHLLEHNIRLMAEGFIDPKNGS